MELSLLCSRVLCKSYQIYQHVCGAERWHAPRLSLHESLLELPEGHLQNGPAASKEPLFRWDLDITRTSTEDLVSKSHYPIFWLNLYYSHKMMYWAVHLV